MDVLFISIKPQYINMILEGKKTIELRKSRPISLSSKYVILYSTSPSKMVVGACEIDSLLELSPDKMWSDYGDSVGISKDDFFEYYKGTDKAIGIKISNIIKFNNGVSLATIKENLPGFSPPQTYKYISIDFLISNFSQYLNESINKMRLTLRHRQPAQTFTEVD